MGKKEKLMKGINLMLLSFPFIFGGPTLFHYKGAQALRNDEPWWLVLSVLLMLIAVFIAVKGLRTIMAAFFDREPNDNVKP